MSSYNAEHVVDLLPVYYERLCPFPQIYQWLSYSEPAVFSRREISFTLSGDIYLRFQSFDSYEEFFSELCEKCPIRINIGAVYLTKPKKQTVFTELKAIEKELFFDIDMTDYDEVRTCCSGADICIKCWKFMVIASNIIDTALREDFGFIHILWVFSGRRGIHAWVSDDQARNLDENCRSGVAQYLHIIKGMNNTKKVCLPGHIRKPVKRALNIIDKYFIDCVVKEQDILGSDERLNNFLEIIDENIRSPFKKNMKEVNTSEARWEAFDRTFMQLQLINQIPRHLKNLKEEIKLHYCYPRLDIQVSKELNHLLKAPFCVHPKTGKVCVPFSIEQVDDFDPNNVPTISMVIDEVYAYDKKVKERGVNEIEMDEPPGKNMKIEDYKKTSLLKPINIFKDFLRNLVNNNNKTK